MNLQIAKTNNNLRVRLETLCTHAQAKEYTIIIAVIYGKRRIFVKLPKNHKRKRNVKKSIFSISS